MSRTSSIKERVEHAFAPERIEARFMDSPKSTGSLRGGGIQWCRVILVDGVLYYKDGGSKVRIPWAEYPLRGSHITAQYVPDREKKEYHWHEVKEREV